MALRPLSSILAGDVINRTDPRISTIPTSPGEDPTIRVQPLGGSADDWFAQQGPPGGPTDETGIATVPGGPEGGGGARDPQAYFQSLIQGKPGTPGTLIGLEPQLAQAGIKVLRNAAGVAGKIQLPSGQIVDVIRGAGLGGGAENWQWDLGGAPGGAGGGGPRPYGTSAAPEAAPFSYAPFEMPQLNETTDPGFAARLAEGLKGVERSAAAKGTLLTGGTLKGLNRYAQDYASNEYGNVFNRALGAYNTNYNTAFQPWQQNYANAYNTWQGNLGAQNQGYNQLYGLANLGLNAAGQQAATGTAYAGQAGNLLGSQATNIGDLYTQRGNAAAAGTVGGANAWQNALGQASNMAQMYYLSRLMQQPQQPPGPTPPYSAGTF